MTDNQNSTASVATPSADRQPCGPAANTLDEKIRAIVENFAQRFDGYVVALSEQIGIIRSGDMAGREAAIEEMLFVAHQLAGSAPTFGFDEIGSVAANVEESLNAAHAGDDRAMETIVSRATKLVETLNDHKARVGA
jgi:HPt (histidine-containing phosphotransfer) domain-containing protein